MNTYNETTLLNASRAAARALIKRAAMADVLEGKIAVSDLKRHESVLLGHFMGDLEDRLFAAESAQKRATPKSINTNLSCH